MLNNQIIEENRTIVIEEGGEYSFSVKKNQAVNFAVVISTEKENEVCFSYDFAADSKVRMVVINHNRGTLQIRERYDLGSDCDITVAYCHLENSECQFDTDYYLNGSGANLLVQGAVIADCRKQFNINTWHKSPLTKAQINNLGVVIGKGNCNMIVKNTIDKGMYQTETHQTTRLLTYDKTAVGKILPILYIDENDVAASHAASLGQPDEAQLFYMQTRGLSRNEALELITVGYLQPVTSVISDKQLNDLLNEEIQKKVKECLMS